MKTLPAAAVLLGLLVTVAAPAQTHSAPPPFGPEDYSATMVIHLAGGATQSMEVAKRGQMWRSRIAVPDRGGQGEMTQLIDLEHKVAYMIMPPMCMKHPLPDLPPAGALEQAQQNHARITDLGPASVTVGGKTYACEHRHLAYVVAGKSMVIDAYTANDLQNFPVKTVLQSGGKSTTVTYENIKLAAPPAAWFVPPANCGSMPAIPGMPHGNAR